MSPAIRCVALVKRYGPLTAVDGVDLEIPRGECFGLLGPNGAGKTTTIEMMEGLTPPSSGHVELLGARWGHDDLALRARIGVQLQETQLADKLTVVEVMRLFRSFCPKGRDPELTLETLGLGGKRDTRVSALSGGQRQRLALATALVGDPELIFLDEPTTGLDPQGRAALWGYIREFQAQGGTVLLTTHYMEEATQLCDRVAIMDHGRVIALDTPGGLIHSLGVSQIVELETAEPHDVDALATLPGVSSARRQGDHSVLHVDRIGVALPAVLAAVSGLELLRLVTHQPTLDDVFMSHTGRALRDA